MLFMMAVYMPPQEAVIVVDVDDVLHFDEVTLVDYNLPAFLATAQVRVVDVNE